MKLTTETGEDTEVELQILFVLRDLCASPGEFPG